MAESSWPSPNHNSRQVDDTEFEQLTHPIGGDGLVGSPADTSFAYADSSGMNVKIRSAKFASVRGRMYYSGGSDITKTVTANASGLTRVDLLVLKLTRATWDITSVVKAGIPGSGAPVLTQDVGTTGVYEIPVATITVPSGDTTISSDQVTMLGYYLGEQLVICTSTTRPHHIAGRRIYETDTQQSYTSNGTTWLSDGAFVCTAATRPAQQAGLLIYETDTGYLQLSTGAAWVPVREDTGWVVVSPASGWTGDGGTIRLRRKNGQVTVVWNLIRSASAAAGATTTMFTVPVGYRPSLSILGVTDVVGAVAGGVNLSSSGILSHRNDEALAEPDRASGSLSWPS